VIVEAQSGISTIAILFVGNNRLDRRASFLGLADAQEHFGLIAATANGPFQIDRQAFLGLGVFPSFRKSGGGLAEVLRRLLESTAGGRLVLVGFVRFRLRLCQRGDSLPTSGQSGVIKDERPVRKVLDVVQLIELFQRLVGVALVAVEERESQPIPGGVDFLVSAVLLEELAEARGGEGEIFLVVGFLSAGQQHGGLLFGRVLAGGRKRPEDDEQTGEGEGTAETPGAVKHPMYLRQVGRVVVRGIPADSGLPPGMDWGLFC
jgi:hypothetical protein